MIRYEMCSNFAKSGRREIGEMVHSYHTFIPMGWECDSSQRWGHKAGPIAQPHSNHIG